MDIGGLQCRQCRIGYVSALRPCMRHTRNRCWRWDACIGIETSVLPAATAASAENVEAAG